MQNAWTRVQGMPDSVRAATVGIALIALALGAWMLTAGQQEHRVPVAPILQSETTPGDPAPDAAPAPATNTVVSVAESSDEGSQSLDVQTNSAATALPGDVSSESSVNQSAAQGNEGTGSNTSSSTSQQHYSSSTTSGDGTSSVRVEITKTTSNEVVTTGPDQDSGASSSVVSHVSSSTGSTAP